VSLAEADDQREKLKEEAVQVRKQTDIKTEKRDWRKERQNGACVASVLLQANETGLYFFALGPREKWSENTSSRAKSEAKAKRSKNNLVPRGRSSRSREREDDRP